VRCLCVHRAHGLPMHCSATIPARGGVYTFYVVKYDAENESHVAQYGTHDDQYACAPAFLALVQSCSLVLVGRQLSRVHRGQTQRRRPRWWRAGAVVRRRCVCRLVVAHVSRHVPYC